MASARPTTAEGTPIGGWVLRADPARFDVEPMIEEFGQVFRYPIPPSDRADLLDAGQPCFLFRSETSRVVGIWAVGEVVAPAFAAPVDPDDPNAGEQLFAEVELLPLVKGIGMNKLRNDPTLAESELFTDPDRIDPVVLRPEEVRALEEFDFTTVEPTDEQLERLEAVLGEDADEPTGVIFQLVGLDESYGVRLDGDPDGLLSVFTINEDGAFELGRYTDFADALSLISMRCGDMALAEPVPPAAPDELPDGDPVAVLETDDGILAIYRTGEDAFDLYDPEPMAGEDEDDDWDDPAGAELLGRSATLEEALAALAEVVEDVPDDDADGDA